MDLINVYIPITSEGDISIMCEWIKENNIECVRLTPRHTENMFGRGYTVGFSFYFEYEEDATAFKLRWLQSNYTQSLVCKVQTGVLIMKLIMIGVKKTVKNGLVVISSLTQPDGISNANQTLPRLS